MKQQSFTSVYESLVSIILPEEILDLFEVIKVEEEHTEKLNETKVRIIRIYRSISY